MTQPTGPQDVNDFHRYDDLDVKSDSHHHTLGPGQYQASAGNHIHDGISAPIGGVYTAVQEDSSPLPPQAALNFNDSDALNDGKTDVVNNTSNGSTDVILRAHQNPDTDLTPDALHHTIGLTANQAAAGNHSHAILAFIFRGTGTPEGNVEAPVGSLYLRSDGATAVVPGDPGTVLYVKETGIDDMGWIAK